MPIPVWAVGQVLAASDVNNWFVPQIAFKNSNQSVTSSTALINDNALFIPMAASASYWFEVMFVYEAANGGDLKYDFTVPAGATLNSVTNYISLSGVAVTWNWNTTGNVTQARGNGAAQLLATSTFGTVVMGGSAGNLQCRWAQNTSSGTSTIMHAGSAIYAVRVG